MLFEVVDDRVTILANHPMVEGGAIASTALLELAAQIAGRAVESVVESAVESEEPAGRGGMLVEVDKCVLHTASVPVGTQIVCRARLLKRFAQLLRFEVQLEGVLSTELTIRLDG
jgi:predicted hotdog family 3-hydroxylacyl-ACP dehydratase